MRRAVFHFVLSVLLTATLMWGECLSCPRLFATKQAQSCCKPAGCEQPKPAESRHQDCKAHPESALTFVKADPEWAPPADPQSLFERIQLPMSTLRAVPAPHEWALIRLAEYSPRELRLLISVFRI